MQQKLHFFFNFIVSCILCNFYCTCCIPTIDTMKMVTRLKTDRNMQVLRTKDEMHISEQCHKSAFVGLCMNMDISDTLNQYFCVL